MFRITQDGPLALKFIRIQNKKRWINFINCFPGNPAKTIIIKLIERQRADKEDHDRGQVPPKTRGAGRRRSGPCT